MDFTIIIPTYRRPQELAGCLSALAQLDYARDAYEVIVVNDGGEKDLENRMTTLVGEMPRTRFLWQENRGPGAARNFGSTKARGKWLAFTDDDCRPRAGWLKGMRSALERGQDVLCGGLTVNQLIENVFSATSQIIVDAAYRFYNPDCLPARFLASNNMGCWRNRFFDAGGFDESFRVASEDRELCDRWIWRGDRILWTQDAVVEHRHDLTLLTFLRQHYAYGRGAARYHQTRKKRGTGCLRNDLPFYGQWPTLLFRPALTARRPVATFSSLILWQIGNAAGFANEVLSDFCTEEQLASPTQAQERFRIREDFAVSHCADGAADFKRTVRSSSFNDRPQNLGGHRQSERFR